MPLSDSAIRAAKPRAKPYRLTDSGGLYIEISPAGGKLWRLKYRHQRKEKRLALGSYPAVTIKDARAKRDAAKKLISDGIDPSQHKQAAKAEQEDRATNTFRAVADEWFRKRMASWKASHQKTLRLRLDNYLIPWLGTKPVAEIKARDVLACARRLEDRGAVESAHRTLQLASQVLRFAVQTGRVERNVAGDLKGALESARETHRAAITDPGEIGALLRAIFDYRGSEVTRAALKLAPLFFVRPGELRHMEWSEVDMAKREWNIPGAKMKMGEPHLVPLCDQALEILQDLHALTGDGRYVFPSPRAAARPMSNNAVLAALRRMGFAKEEMSGHGFRAMARTILDEELGVDPHLIEHQLAHAVRDPNGRAYNRTTHLPRRRAMMQQWADYLDSRRIGGNVVPLARRA